MRSDIEDDGICMWLQIYRSLSSCNNGIQAAQAALERQVLVYYYLKAQLKKTKVHNDCHKRLQTKALGEISHRIALLEQFVVPQLTRLGSQVTKKTKQSQEFIRAVLSFPQYASCSS